MKAKDVICLFHCGAREGTECWFGNGHAIVGGYHTTRIHLAEIVSRATSESERNVLRKLGLIPPGRRE